VTLAQNEARAGAGGSASGGGLAVAADVTATIDNAILAGNVRVDDAGLTVDSDCVSQGALVSAGYNLAVTPDASCSFSAAGDRVGVDPLLAAVADSGCVAPLPDGSCPPTMAIDETSPAVDAGSCLASRTETDARGSARFQDVAGVANVDDACDIGAFEAYDLNGDGAVDVADLCPGGDGNACDLCLGNDALGDGDMDGLCADRDCDDGDPANACEVFEGGFETGDTSPWSATIGGS
ncbi:MAG: choice-of-anchor Q domain-containing protein, partial [Acidobacteriota bacterium]